MITFERLTLDTDFEVWDILHHDIKIGCLSKSFKYIKKDYITHLTNEVDAYHLEIFYVHYRLPITARKHILTIIEGAVSYYEAKKTMNAWKNSNIYKNIVANKYDFKTLKEGREGFTIKD